MPRAIDGSMVPESIDIPCGGETHFDEGSGCSYRCWTCMATVGSIAMPRKCKKLMDWDSELKQVKECEDKIAGV